MALGSALGGLGGGIAILAGAGGKGGYQDLENIRNLWLKIQNSDFDFTKLSWPELQQVQQLMPEVYQAIVPKEAQTAQETPGARDAQVQALSRVEDIAGGGLPLADRIAAERAQGAISQEMRGRDLAVLRNLAARGGLASGDEAQLRMIGSAQAGNTARDLGTALQESALQRRMGAIGQSAAQAGALREGDFGINAFNADTVNRFNAMVAGMQTDAARENALARGEANRYNVGTQQRLAEENQLGRLGLSQSERERQDELKKTLFSQDVTRAKGLEGAYAALSDWKDRERARKEKAIAGIAGGVGGILDFGLGGGLGGLLNTGGAGGGGGGGTTAYI